ncbi:DUF92 domain-containing protein [Acholeplasma granularum]|uniref:DUF92 domain-containing protein n=1 Tax=Acholeplasma granularum TaxID=264635 RepID=UPI00046FEC73|nr:DUF92 domain-containing protein [Acholeplasma granularum]
MLVLGIIGFALSFLITITAYIKKSLTLSGFLSATIIGTLFFMFGSYVVWSVLIFFFFSSSIITKFNKDDKEKNGRNFIQVISNSVVSLTFLILYYYLDELPYLIVSVVAIAASTADTWASEIGAMSKGKTFSILTFKKMEKGLSGAVSLTGTISSLFGAIAVALLFNLLYFIENSFNIFLFSEFLIIISIAGFLGSLLDSYLGIFLQAKYKDLKSGKIIEFISNKGQHILISGNKFVNNNTVNFIMVLTISIVTYIILII